MQITTRAYTPEDFERCRWIEQGAVKANHYFADVIDYYRTTAGELTVACVDGQPVGMGKLTVLYDGSAWLELLRVHPDFQRKGVGRAIYRRYFEQIEQLGCPAARMYTGVRNVASAGLAECFGLRRGPEFHSMSAPTPDETHPTGLHRIEAAEAIERLPELVAQTGGFLSINHTFCQLNEQTLRGFAAAGWLWAEGETLLVAGARFQPRKALYIAAALGQTERALDHARHLAAVGGAQKLTFHFAPDQQELRELCAANGFEDDPSDDVVMEWIRP